MTRPDSLRILVLTALLAFAAGAPAQDSAAGIRPDAPPYALPGPHAVGARDAAIEGAAPLEITVWYPAVAADGTEGGTSYAYTFKWEMPPGSVATIAGRALRDAPADAAAGPSPLVVLSPGFAVGRASYAWLGEHLASHGFVVIAPEHAERMDPELSGFWPGAVTRPRDVRAALAWVDAQAAPDGALAGIVDPQLVAVVGHSYGGYTALAAAGARIDSAGFASHCDAARRASDPAAWLCDLFEAQWNEMAALADLDAAPDGLWPAAGDPRVDAAVSMAGDAYLFGRAGLAEVSVPTLALGGTADTGTPYAWGIGPTFDHVASARKARAAFENAEHMIFGASCDALPVLVEIGFHGFCSDPVWDMERAHDLIGHFTTAFLLAELKGDAEAAAALAPGTVAFPGVVYEAVGY